SFQIGSPASVLIRVSMARTRCGALRQRRFTSAPENLRAVQLLLGHTKNREQGALSRHRGRRRSRDSRTTRRLNYPGRADVLCPNSKAGSGQKATVRLTEYGAG